MLHCVNPERFHTANRIQMEDAMALMTDDEMVGAIRAALFKRFGAERSIGKLQVVIDQLKEMV